MVKDDFLPLVPRERRKTGSDPLTNIGANTFRNLLKSKGAGNDFKLYQVVLIKSLNMK